VLRRRDLSWRPMMLVTGLCFAAMNALYVTALADSSQGASANAAWLQYTAPMWMYLVSVWLLGEPADRRGAVVLGIGLAGVAVIVWGGWQNENLRIVVLALGSGVAFAGVMVGLRVLRDVSSRWLTVFNHLFSAFVLMPFLWLWGVELPGASQLLVLFVFGAVQMALPYWLVARSLRSVSPQEAGTITLLEPLLTPVWAYLVSPTTETPTGYTLVGGALILGALAWRYWPFRQPPAAERVPG
jgi:drug/metabolite transporter (DMT)-like permease